MIKRYFWFLICIVICQTAFASITWSDQTEDERQMILNVCAAPRAVYGPTKYYECIDDQIYKLKRYKDSKKKVVINNETSPKKEGIEANDPIDFLNNPPYTNLKTNTPVDSPRSTTQSAVRPPYSNKDKGKNKMDGKVTPKDDKSIGRSTEQTVAPANRSGLLPDFNKTPGKWVTPDNNEPVSSKLPDLNNTPGKVIGSRDDFGGATANPKYNQMLAPVQSNDSSGSLYSSVITFISTVLIIFVVFISLVILFALVDSWWIDPTYDKRMKAYADGSFRTSMGYHDTPEDNTTSETNTETNSESNSAESEPPPNNSDDEPPSSESTHQYYCADYDILGVPQNASMSEIKAAYRKGRSKHHPDHGGDGVKFIVLKEAYDRLCKLHHMSQ